MNTKGVEIVKTLHMGNGKDVLESKDGTIYSGDINEPGTVQESDAEKVARKFSEKAMVSLDEACCMMPPALWPPHIIEALHEAQIQEDGSNLLGDDLLEVPTKMRRNMLGGVEDGIVTLKDLYDDDDDDDDDLSGSDKDAAAAAEEVNQAHFVDTTYADWKERTINAPVFHGMGFDSKEEYDKCVTMGFDSKDKYDKCVAMGFESKEEYDELYNKCVAMGFDSKKEYDKCMALVLTNTIDIS